MKLAVKSNSSLGKRNRPPMEWTSIDTISGNMKLKKISKNEHIHPFFSSGKDNISRIVSEKEVFEIYRLLVFEIQIDDVWDIIWRCPMKADRENFVLQLQWLVKPNRKLDTVSFCFRFVTDETRSGNRQKTRSERIRNGGAFRRSAFQLRKMRGGMRWFRKRIEEWNCLGRQFKKMGGSSFRWANEWGRKKDVKEDL